MGKAASVGFLGMSAEKMPLELRLMERYQCEGLGSEPSRVFEEQ